MSSWIFFAILSPAIYTVCYFIDKYNIEKQVKDYRGMSLFSATVCLVVGLILWSLTGFPILTFRDASLVILSGAFSIWGTALYFWLLSVEDATKVVFYYQLIPVAVLVLSYLFLEETLTAWQLLGFVLVIVPALFLSRPKITDGKLASSAFSFFLIIVSNLMFALSSIVYKFVLNNLSFSSTIAYESFGWVWGALVMVLFFPAVKTSFLFTLKSVPRYALLLIFGSEVIYIFAKFAFFYAASLGSVSLVNVIGGTQVIFAVIYGLILSKVFPKFFDEKITRSSLIEKSILALITVLGLALIS